MLNAIIKFCFRFLAGIWALAVILGVTYWILVYFNYFPESSSIIAIGFIPPFWFILFFLPPIIVFWLTKNRRISLFLIIAYLITLFSFGDFSYQKNESVTVAKDDKVLKVIALNVRYYSLGMEGVVDFIKSKNADVYLLSENVLKAKQLVKFREQIKPFHLRMGRQEGTAIISKLPVIDFNEVEFPSRQASLFRRNFIHEQNENPFRSFVHAVINFDNKPVHVISVRFIAGRAQSKSFKDTYEWGLYLLENQIKELAFFKKYIANIKGPIVFGGDLNATPSSFLVRSLGKIARDAYLESHFWGGFTFWTNFPSYARLDYLFYNDRVKLVHSERLDDVVSDHYPVLGEFVIPN